MRRGLLYFLLFSMYGVINTYLPLALRSLGFSNGDVGVLLAIGEAVGFTIPFFIIPALDKSCRYGLVMLLLGLDMVFLLLPLTVYRSFWIAAIAMGMFAIGLKGLVPILDGFITRLLGNNNSGYGKIRAVGSMGFVCTSLFLQFTPFVSGKNSMSVIAAISTIAALFSLGVAIMPEAFDTQRLKILSENANMQNNQNTKKATAIPHTNGSPTPAFSKTFWFLLFLMFSAFMGLAPCQRFFSLYVSEYLHLDIAAALWALSGIMEIPVMIFSGKLIKRFGTEKLLLVCLLSIAIRDISYIVFPCIGGAIIGQSLHAISFGLFHPVSIIVCVSHCGGRTATAMILFNAANGIANVIASIVGGYLIQYAGYPALFIFFSVFPAAAIGLYFMRKHFRLLRENISYHA